MPIFGELLRRRLRAARARVFGLLGTASGLGALVGSVALANRKSVVGLGRLIAIAIGVFAVALVAFGASRLPVAVPADRAGRRLGDDHALRRLQHHPADVADDDKRGRVMSFFSMAFIGMTPLGNLPVGVAGRPARSRAANGDSCRPSRGRRGRC